MVKYSVVVNNIKYEVDVEEITPNKFKVSVNGKEEIIEMFEERAKIVSETTAVPAAKAPVKTEAAGKEIKAEMSGTIVRVLVKPGDVVKKGQPVLVLEAMKMENEVVSPFDGVVESVEVTEGAKVQAGDVLIRFKAEEVEAAEVAEKPTGEGKEIKAEMSGTIVRILKKEGDTVSKGEPVLVLEAMKMENEIVSPYDGVISKIAVKEGDKVQAGEVLAVIS